MRTLNKARLALRASRGFYAPTRVGALIEVPWDELYEAPEARRNLWDLETQRRLVETISETGIIEPLLVRRRADQRWEIHRGVEIWFAVVALIQIGRWAPDNRLPCRVVDAWGSYVADPLREPKGGLLNV